MTIDEAIERFNHNAEYERANGDLQGCLEFRQLIDWLKDYKRLLEQEPKNKDLINHIEAVQEALNNMVDGLNDDTDYYNATYHLEQIKKRWRNESKNT